MTALTETGHRAEFLMSEAPGTRSREVGTFSQSQTVEVGQIVSKVTRGTTAVAAVAVAGNTGNGAWGSITLDAGGQLGDYKVVCIEPGTNAGKFEVFRPDGELDGVLTVGVAYNGMINGTLADGGADFVSGDAFDVTATETDAANEGQVVPYDPTATNGAQTPVGVSLDKVVTGSGETIDNVIIAREAEVNGNLIVYQSGADDAAKAVANGLLAHLGITVR